MRKLSLYILLSLMFCNVVFANDIKKLNKKLLEIEARLDVCLDTKDKDICMKFMMDNPLLLEIFGNEGFAKLLSTSKCQVGTKCGATNARILAKTLQASSLVMELD
jgi:hypothetical protein